MTTLTTRAVEAIEDASTRDAGRAKNFFALGLLSWLYGRPTEVTERWIEQKFARQAGRAEGEPGGVQRRLVVRRDDRAARRPVPRQAGHRTSRRAPTATSTARPRWRSGWSPRASAAACRCCSRATRSPPPPSSCTSSPPRAASACRTIQAEDEIAAAGMALGAAFGGRLGVTATSGPGMDLKAETIGLAVALELPMIVVDVQRAGPSTGMPTKTEQSDLLMALYGRHGESPLPVLAPSTPAGCFEVAFEAVQIAIRYRTPVIILSDTFLASSSEPWLIPTVADLAGDRPGASPTAPATTASRSCPTRATSGSRGPGRSPGRPGLQHRIGGLEKADGSGNISYDGANHARMTELRAAKIAGIARELAAARGRLRAGRAAARARLGLERGRDPRRRQAGSAGRPQGRVRPPAPPQPAARRTSARCSRSFDRVLVPEMNTGQLAHGAARQVPGRRRVLLQGPGPAAVLRRDRNGDRGAPGDERDHERTRPATAARPSR